MNCDDVYISIFGGCVNNVGFMFVGDKRYDAAAGEMAYCFDDKAFRQQPAD